jgi:hypothetical protein
MIAGLALIQFQWYDRKPKRFKKAWKEGGRYRGCGATQKTCKS